MTAILCGRHCRAISTEPPTVDELRSTFRNYPLREMIARRWIDGDIKDDRQMFAALVRFFHGKEAEL